MKTNNLKMAFTLILNAFVILTLTSCGNKTRNMHWDVSSLNEEHVEITFDPSRQPQIEIVANAEGGECQLYCHNYENISFREGHLSSNTHLNYQCQFEAEISDSGVIIVRLGEMPKDNREFHAYFMIDGFNKNDMSATVVKVTRRHPNVFDPIHYNSTNLASLE